MNERIRELDKQAVDYALSVCDADGVYQGKEYLSVVKEKFAELIAKECLKLCKEVEDDLDGIYEDAEREATKIGARFCYEAIKGEFGVEE